MIVAKTYCRILMAGLVLLLLSACGDKPVEQPVMLAHVPADTPYVFANQQARPRELNEKLLRYVAADFDKSAQQIRLIAENEQLNDQATALLLAILAELEGKLSLEGIESLGFHADAKTVFYGLGLFPVLRTEIRDAQKIRDLVARIERRSGLQAPLAQHGEQPYWRFDLGELVAVIAVTDQYLIAAVLPAEAEDEFLPYLLGDELPQPSLASRNTYSDLVTEYGFTGHGEGYIDLQLITRIILSQDRQQNGTDAGGIPSGCKTMLTELVDAAPRYVFGTTEATQSRFAMRAVMETSPAVAAYLQRIAAPVPGLGERSDAMLSFGMGINLPELRAALTALIDTVQLQGKDCAWVNEEKLNASRTKIELALNPFISGIKGFRLEAQDIAFDTETMMPSNVQAKLLVAADDPRGLLAMLGMFNPELAQLDVPADGTAVALPLDTVAPDMPPVYAAILGKALAFSSEPGSDQQLAEFLRGALLKPSPMLVMAYDVSRLLHRVDEMSGPMLARMEQEGEQQQADDLRAELESFKAYARAFGPITVRIAGSEKGLVIDQALELK